MMPFHQNILQAYGLNNNAEVVPFGTGLINHTWRVISGKENFILQKINNHVFRKPEHIAHNIDLISAHLGTYHPGYLFVRPVRTVDGRSMIHDAEQGYFRLFPFVEGSQTVAVVDSADRAFEAAGAFGRFTQLLSELDPTELKITIPSFHDLSLRYQQFTEALSKGNPDRIRETRDCIDQIRSNENIVNEYELIKKDPAFRIRVTHHDTKISNVLFDSTGKALCVIDPDTIMPGYFISDIGDMMRTYLSPVSEEETDLSKIEVRDEMFHAIVKGYSLYMNDELTEKEKEYFVYAGKFMTYMQGLRFLTDYLNNDVYYGAGYPGHNLMRSRNQLRLLDILIEKETRLSGVTPAY